MTVFTAALGIARVGIRAMAASRFLAYEDQNAIIYSFFRSELFQYFLYEQGNILIFIVPSFSFAGTRFLKIRILMPLASRILRQFGAVLCQMPYFLGCACSYPLWTTLRIGVKRHLPERGITKHVLFVRLFRAIRDLETLERAIYL